MRQGLTIGLLGGLAVTVAATAWAAGGGHGAEAEEGAGAAAPVTPTISLPNNQRNFSAAEAELLQELERRRVDMDRREQALELREHLADLLEQRLATRTGALQDLKTQIEGLMKNVSGKDDKELYQLSQMYAAMKPDVAASVLDRLDNAIVQDVLTRMPVKKSGKIMEMLDPAKSRKISEMMAARTMLPQLSAAAGVKVSATTPQAAAR